MPPACHARRSTQGTDRFRAISNGAAQQPCRRLALDWSAPQYAGGKPPTVPPSAPGPGRHRTRAPCAASGWGSAPPLDFSDTTTTIRPVGPSSSRTRALLTDRRTLPGDSNLLPRASFCRKMHIMRHISLDTVRVNTTIATPVRRREAVNLRRFITDPRMMHVALRVIDNLAGLRCSKPAPSGTDRPPEERGSRSPGGHSPRLAAWPHQPRPPGPRKA